MKTRQQTKTEMLKQINKKKKLLDSDGPNQSQSIRHQPTYLKSSGRNRYIFLNSYTTI